MKLIINIFSLTFFICAFFSNLSASDYQFEVLDKSAVKAATGKIGEIMYESYREYPYLWGWNDKEYQEYIEEELASKKDLILVSAKINDKVVGIIAGFPLKDGEDIFSNNTRNAMVEHNFETQNYFYLAETVIEKSHRNKGLLRPMLKRFYEASSEKGYTKICASVADEFESVLKYQDYKKLNIMWYKLGFDRTSIIIPIPWDTIISSDGKIENMEHKVSVWIKHINEK